MSVSLAGAPHWLQYFVALLLAVVVDKWGKCMVAHMFGLELAYMLMPSMPPINESKFSPESTAKTVINVPHFECSMWFIHKSLSKNYG